MIVHSLDDARAALSAVRAAGGSALLLASAPAAGCYAGSGWFAALLAVSRAEYPDIAIEAELDCADQPGAVLAALRAGIDRIRFRGESAAADRLREIAAERGAIFETGAAPAGLDLRGAADPGTLCRAYLSGNARAS